MKPWVEIRRRRIAVAEEGAGMPGPDQPEALGRPSQPGLEVAPEGICEKQPDVRVGAAQGQEVEKIERPFCREGMNRVGNAPGGEERRELREGDQRDRGVGAGLAQRAQEGKGHDDVAQPVGEPHPDPRAPRHFRKAARGQVRGEQVALGLQAEPPRGHVLVAPAIVNPEPPAAERLVAEGILQPAVERERRPRRRAVVRDRVGLKHDPPEAGPPGVDSPKVGGVAAREKPRQFAR